MTKEADNQDQLLMILDLLSPERIRTREEGLIDGIDLSNISKHHLLRAANQTEIVLQAHNLLAYANRLPACRTW